MKRIAALLAASLAIGCYRVCAGLQLESCSSQGSYVLIGDKVRCSGSGSCSNGTSTVNGAKGMQFYNLPGVFSYSASCNASNDDDDNSGNSNITVLSSQYRVGLCSSCAHQDLLIKTGQMIHWTATNDLNCSQLRLVVAASSCTGQPLLTFMSSGSSHHVYTFNQSGVYHLYCNRDCKKLATVTVLNNNGAENGSKEAKHKEIIYTHAVVMVFSFAVILPLGALLANLKKPIIHMILQPLGMILAIIGLIMAIAYKEFNETTHFNRLHTIFGLLLMIVAIIAQPALKFSVMSPMREKWKKLVTLWHKRLGLVAVFSGIFNIFLGLSILPDVPNYVTILYGVWTIVLMMVFVLAKRGGSSMRDDDEESALNTCCHYRKDQVTLTRRDSLPPSKLTRDPFEKEKFVMVRKKSVDMLEVKVNQNKPSRGSGMPQRKTSNVHFGPVAIAAQLTPPVPYTPQDNSTHFGFNNQLANHYNEGNEDGTTGSSSSSSDSDGESSDESCSIDGESSPPNVEVKEARTEGKCDSQFSLNSIASSGGSIRITRHSDRAHTKVSEIFPQGQTMSNSQQQPPPVIIAPSPLLQSSKKISTDSNDDAPSFNVSSKDATSDEEEKQRKEVSPDDFPRRCPMSRSGFSDSSLPAPHQRRMRKNAYTAALGDIEDRLKVPQEMPEQQQELSPRRPMLQRGLSRNASFRRKQAMVDNTLRSVMEMSDNAIICANAQGEIVFWSAGAMKMFGYTPKEAIGSSLQIIMPHRFREKHQNGVNGRTERATEYIRKHHCAPEEQKHARLYSVAGVSKTGKEFEVEVVVTSFVIEEDIFYTGIITEVKGLTRHLSVSSISSDVEIREKQQKAMAIGAQMKLAHKLKSADHINRNELTKILKTSLQGTQFEVPPEDITAMVDGIVKAADADESGIIKFVDLIELLAKHRLYISDSGFIAKYGKTKSSERKNIKATKTCGSRAASFLSSHVTSIGWGVTYLFINVLLLLIGVLSTPNNGWGQWAYGTGPALSFNLVLALVPMMKSLIHNMRGSPWLNKVLPLKDGLFFHLFIIIVIFGLTLVHTFTHLCSFTFDEVETNSTQLDNFRENIELHLMPLITGGLLILILFVMTLTSCKCISKLCLFIGFNVIHWIGFVSLYVILLLHGIDYYNPSFWKWLLPFVLVYALERAYFRWVVPRYTVRVLKSCPYDEQSRTTKLEIQKPAHYKFIAGQHLLINMPQIGYFKWQPCYVSNTNKEKTLTLYFPHTGSSWLERVYSTYKENPIKPQDGEPSPHSVTITTPFGPGVDHVFDYKAVVLMCGAGGAGLSTCRSIIQKFLQYRRKGSTCPCGLHPILSKLYFVWVTPSGNDNEWFTDFLSELIEDEHLQKYLDIRIFLTNIDSPPDELASALLHLALKTGGPALSVRRPSQPQLSKLYANTSYGVPDFESLLDFVSMQQATSDEKVAECGVFTAGSLPHNVINDLVHYCNVCSKKKGPSLNLIDSPYRKLSATSPPTLASPTRTDGGSPTAIPQPPPEWHITFKPQPLIL